MEQVRSGFGSHSPSHIPNISTDSININPAPLSPLPPQSNDTGGKKKEVKRCSKVWQHFDTFVDENGQDKARCKYCKGVLKASTKGNGTTSLLNHIKRHCKEYKRLEDVNQTQLNFKETGTNSDGMTKVTSLVR